jgi:small subunit ribosomal protein S1
MPEGISVGDLEQWDVFHDVKNRDGSLSAFVVSVITPKTLGGRYWELKFDGMRNIRGLVPSSEAGLPDEGMLGLFIGQEVSVKIRSIDKKNGIVACTRREVVEEARARLVNTLIEGEEILALVRFATDRRVGLDIGGGVIIGVPRQAAAPSRSVPLNVQYRPGQLVLAVVQAVDKKAGIEVSIKDPWENESFTRGDVVTGRIVRVRGKELFVEVEARPGLIALAHQPAGKELKEGDAVPFQVTFFDSGKKKMHMDVLNPEWIRGRRAARARRSKEAASS